MYWCAACGNPRVIIEKEREGYSLTKGLVGSAVLGPVGALAGADGKEVTLFYCPKCGARLHKSMPENEVSIILRLLNEAKTSAFAKSALDKMREKYPNMLWPEELDHIWNEVSKHSERSNLASNEQDNPYDVLSDASNNQTVDFSGDVKKDIKDYLNNINAPVSYSELKDSFKDSSYSEIAIINGVLDLIENGLIKYQGGYFAIVRDLDEMIQLKECGNENRNKLEEEVFSFKKDLENSEHVAQQQEEDRIIEAIGYIYRYKLVLCRVKAQQSQSLCERIAEELNRLESNKEEDIKKTEQSIKILQSSLSIKCEEAINSTIAAIKEKESELNRLSFLQLGRKRALKDEIEALNDKKLRLQRDKANAEGQILDLQKRRNFIESSTESDVKTKTERLNREKELFKRWNLAIKDLEDKIEWLNQGKIDENVYTEAARQVKFAKNQATYATDSTIINKTIEKVIALEDDYVTVEDLHNKYRELRDASLQKIASVLSLLQSKGYVEKKVMYGKMRYKSIKPSNYFKSTNEQSRIVTKDEIKYRLFQIINNAEEPVNIPNLMEKVNFSGIQVQQYGAMLGQMEKDGIIKKVKKDNKTYYCVQTGA